MASKNLFQSSRPAMSMRGVHLDLKGVQPTFKRLIQLLKVFAAARYNVVLVEWEDAFPWKMDKRFQSETAYTPKEVAHFYAAAEKLGLEIIPLVQCLGHLEIPLSLPGYKHLREVPHQSDVLNPLAPGAVKLVRKMIEDVLSISPQLKYFHLGGDEAWSFGTNPKTKAHIRKHGKGAVYLKHVEPILDLLNARGIRPILWHDMMRDWEPTALKKLSQKADLMVWGYQAHPDKTHYHYKSKIIERFKNHGITLWGAGAYKGAEEHNDDLPDLLARQNNALAWMDVGRRYGFKGVVATGWSRFSTHRGQNEPIDAALDSLVNLGVIFHDAKLPQGGMEACVKFLGSIGEKKRFETCKRAMEKLGKTRGLGWKWVSYLREQIVVSTMDVRRRGSPPIITYLQMLKQGLDEAEIAASETRRAFRGLIPPIWIEEYLAQRLEPLREEFEILKPRVRKLEPEAYRALQKA